MAIKSVCVFCGASSGDNSAYLEDATRLGIEFAKNGINLVYGGGGAGIMGQIADTVFENGGEVIGIIPDYLRSHELGHEKISRLEVVKNMHERKKRMFDLADGIVVLPGGVGTLEEALEVITWKQLGMHNKPVAILNTLGYWTKLDELIVSTIKHKFAAPPTGDLYEMVDRPNEIIETLELSQQNPVDTDLARL